jgi:hypothetical protein
MYNNYYDGDYDIYYEIKNYPIICKTLCIAYRRKLHKLPKYILHDALWYSSYEYQQVKNILKSILCRCMKYDFIYNIMHFIDNDKIDIQLYQEQFTCSDITCIKNYVLYKGTEDIILSFLFEIEHWIMVRRNNFSNIIISANKINQYIDKILYYTYLEKKIDSNIVLIIISFLF